MNSEVGGGARRIVCLRKGGDVLFGWLVGREGGREGGGWKGDG